MKSWLSILTKKLIMDLLPTLFKEAFIDRFTRGVKAVVTAWPSFYLPGVINKIQKKIFQAGLEGRYILLTQNVKVR